ncbi:MAG: CapA family protein [Aristaeellaceae bacterium]
MRRMLCLLMCLMLLAPSAALADKTITLTFTGDVTLGSEEKKRSKDVSFDSVAAREGYDYFFANVRDFFAEDDLTIINLEGVLSDSSRQENKEKTYRFRGPTDFVSILTRSSIEVCSIANNHTMDFGRQGYNSTISTLHGAGLGVFGNDEIYIYEKDGIQIAFLSINSTSVYRRREWLRTEMARLKSDVGVNCIVFCLHAGTEYGRRRNQAQENVARTAIDNGADLVVMHHPHVVQGFDVYNNRSICYSLGNFCFGGNKDVRAMEAMVVRATLTFADDGTYLGQQLALYPANISGTYPGNNYQPLLVSGDAAQAAMELAQFDTLYTLNPFDDAAGCALQDYLPAN